MALQADIPLPASLRSTIPPELFQSRVDEKTPESCGAGVPDLVHRATLAGETMVDEPFEGSVLPLEPGILRPQRRTRIPEDSSHLFCQEEVGISCLEMLSSSRSETR